ncbi:MAG: hypothetical protein WC728_17860 [Elusimicrobiota bacterium]
MAQRDEDQPLPRLRGKEKRRESKGAGFIVGQGGTVGVGTTPLVPGPLVQAGKVMLAAGGLTGTTKPGMLSAVFSLVTTKLPALATVLLTGATVGFLFQTFKSKPVAAPTRPEVFRATLKPFEEPAFDGREHDSYDSLTYLMAGNQGSDKLRDSLAVQENLREAAAMQTPEEEEEERKPEAVAPGAAVPNAAAEEPVSQERKVADGAAKDLTKVSVSGPGMTLIGGDGMWNGINRKFDPNAVLKLAQGRLLPANAAAFAAQQSPYHGLGGMNSRAKIGKSAALTQLYSAHQKSRKALRQSSGEGKAAAASQAFGGSAKARSGRVRASAKRIDGAESAPMTFDTNDGGPISTPFSGQTPAPSMGQTADQSPWTPDLQRAKDKLQDASSLITVIGILAPFKMIPIVGPIVMMVQGILYSMALSYSSTAMDIGTSIQSSWAQPQQSDIVTTGSGITDAAAAAAMAAPVSMTAWASVLAGVAGIAALVGVLLASKR